MFDGTARNESSPPRSECGPVADGSLGIPYLPVGRMADPAET